MKVNVLATAHMTPSQPGQWTSNFGHQTESPLHHTIVWTCRVVQLSWKTMVTWCRRHQRLWMYRNDIWIGRSRVGDPWPPGSRWDVWSGADGLPAGLYLPVNSWKLCSSTDTTIKLTAWRVAAERRRISDRHRQLLYSVNTFLTMNRHSCRTHAIYRVKNAIWTASGHNRKQTTLKIFTPDITQYTWR